MLRLSKLYAYINTCLQNQDFQSLIHSNGMSYRLHELNQVDFSLNLDGAKFSLESQHLSFFEQQDDFNSALSEYHYTMYVTDGNTRYQWHVHLNDKDQITCPPELKVQQADGTYLPSRVFSAEAYQAVLDLAIMQSQKFMLPFRAQYQTSLDADIRLFNAMDLQMQTLSKDLHANKVEYSDKLNEASDFLRRISHYHYENQYHLAILSLFTKMQASLAKLRPVKYKQEFPEAPTLVRSISDEPENVALHVLPISLVAQDHLQNIIRDAQAALEHYKTQLANKAAPELLIDSILASLQLANDANLSSTASTALEHLEAVHVLLQSNYQLKQQLLQRLIFRGDLMQAGKLVGNYSSELDPSWVKMAVQSGKALMLDFLLTRGNFPVNSLSMGNNLSMAMYCFVEEQKPQVPGIKRASKLSCLDVLIKHGICLMELEPKSKLPLAILMMLDKVYGFREVLGDNQAITLGNKQFLKNIIHYVKKDPVHSRDPVLSALIEDCQFRLRQGNSPITGFYQTHQEKLRKKIHSKLTVQQAQELSLDSVLGELWLQRNALQETHNRMLSGRELLTQRLKNKDLQKTLMELSDMRQIPIAELKDAMKLFLLNEMETIKLAIELRKLQKDIRKTKSKSKKSNSLLAEQTQIMAKIKELGKPYEFMSESVSNQLQIELDCVVESLSNLMQSLVKLQSALNELKEIVNVSESSHTPTIEFVGEVSDFEDDEESKTLRVAHLLARSPVFNAVNTDDELPDLDNVPNFEDYARANSPD